MGSYATTSSLSQLLPNALSGGTTTSDTEATATFATHITRAESEINGVLAEKYSLPFTTVPPALRSWAEDLACYYFLRAAMSQDGRVSSGALATFEPAYSRLLAAQNVGFKGILSLTDSAVVPRNTLDRYKSSTEGEGQVFGLDDERNWGPDPDRIDRDEDARQ